MKSLTFFILFGYLVYTEFPIFTNDLIVYDINFKEFNLKNLEIRKDTVILMVWNKTCGSCIKHLNSLKENTTKQIIAIAMVDNLSIDREKSLILANGWKYDMFFDNRQNLVKYLIDKRYLTQYEVSKGRYRFFYPQIFMFAKGKLICKGCDKFMPR